MIKIDEYELEKLIRKGEDKFSYEIEPNIISRIQLYLTGRITKGVELFGIGPNEIRALGLLVEYSRAINYAIKNQYKVYVKKEGNYFGQGTWSLEFIKY